jgi:hypothetical protein
VTPRIVNTTAFGWIDMNHVLRVTPVEWQPNTRGSGGYLEFCVFVMMRDRPFVWTGEWDRNDMGPTQEQLDEADAVIRPFLLQWKGKP